VNYYKLLVTIARKEKRKKFDWLGIIQEHNPYNRAGLPRTEIENGPGIQIVGHKSPVPGLKYQYSHTVSWVMSVQKILLTVYVVLLLARVSGMINFKAARFKF
jgi:hypothetical protein